MKKSFNEVSTKIYETYGEKSILPILFAVSSVFKSEIVKINGCFPNLILNGNFATGKTSIASFIKQMLGQQNSTIYDFKNRAELFEKLSKKEIAFFDEYRISDTKNDQLIKAIYDNATAHIGTKEIGQTQGYAFNSTLILSMVELPKDTTILNRCLIQQFFKSNFSKEEIDLYEGLKAFFFENNCNCIDEIYSFKKHIEDNFELKLIENRKNLIGMFTSQRVTNNYNLIQSIYYLLKDKIDFPFDEKMFTKSILTNMLRTKKLSNE